MRADPVLVVERLYNDFYNQRDLTIAKQVAASIFRYPQRFVAEYTAVRLAFPDMQFNRERTFQDGKHVTVRWSAQGTQDGELALPHVRIPATHRHIETLGISIFEVSNGQIIQRVWASSDSLDMLYRLGVRFEPPSLPAQTTRRTPRLP